MTNEDAHLARAERAFRPQHARHEKGSALELIAAEAKATEDKTARLRALRLEQAAALVQETRQQDTRKTTKRAAARS